MEVLNKLKIGDKVKYTRFIPFGDEYGNETLEDVGFVGTIEDIKTTRHDTIYYIKYFCEYAKEDVIEEVCRSHIEKGYDKQKIEILTNNIYNKLSKQATRKDIITVIEARQKNDYTQAHATRLYKNKGNIYCRVLELIN